MPSHTPSQAQEDDRPRTLQQAKEIIQRLKKQLPGSSAELGLSIPPVHGTPGTVAPVRRPDPPPRPNPDPSRPGSPGTASLLSAMPPKALAKFLEERTDKELHALLGAENSKDRKTVDSKVVMALYQEIKSR